MKKIDSITCARRPATTFYCFYTFFCIKKTVPPRFPLYLNSLGIRRSCLPHWRDPAHFEWPANILFLNSDPEHDNTLFYSCGTSVLAFEWKWGWGWPCFNTNLLPFLTEIMPKKYYLLAWEQHNLHRKEGDKEYFREPWIACFIPRELLNHLSIPRETWFW